jgi:hypothetical protein
MRGITRVKGGAVRGWWASLASEAKIAVVGVLVALIGAVPSYLALRDGGGDPGQRGPEAQSATTTSGTSTSLDATTTTDTDSTTSSTLLEPPAPETQYLEELEAVNDAPLAGPRTIAGTSYGHSVATSIGGCARNQETTFEYALSAQWKELLATIGLDDESKDSKAVAQFDVYLDARLVKTASLGLGKRARLDLPLDGVIRLTLKVTYVKGTVPPGICSEAGYAVWGDARLSA